MTRPRDNAARFFHETWLGMVQPTEGLVVSIPALLEAEAFERLSTDDHHAFKEFLEAGPDGALRLADPRRFLLDPVSSLHGSQPLPRTPDANAS